MNKSLKVIRIYTKGRGLIQEIILPDDSQNSQSRDVYVYRRANPLEEENFKKYRDLDAKKK
ncbi:hypothetical protein J7K44_00495 [bacterium]|nr:hypothetical protein [bacterium]